MTSFGLKEDRKLVCSSLWIAVGALGLCVLAGQAFAAENDVAPAIGCCNAFVQNTAAGEVVDSSGAAVVNAEVTLVNGQGHAVRHATTNEHGAYSLPAVPAGVYSLTVAANGFAGYEQAGITVTATQNLTLNVQLKLEATSQSVTVKDSSALLEVQPSVGKTGTLIEDIPNSVQIIGHLRAEEQGDVSLRETIRNSSGIIQGGADGFGFGDKFQIRGMEARIYNDGFSDGDARNGIPHSLNGVDHVEILEGPGSALFGSGPPGGTINMVHYLPSAVPHYGLDFHTGSFGLYSGSAFATGHTGVQGLDYRVDGLAQHEDGFRSLESSDYELRPELSWAVGNHFLTVSADGRDLNAVPDPAGLIYVNAADPLHTATLGGTPITGVSRETKYSTPFSLGDQTMGRLIVADSWAAKPYVTVGTHFSYMYRNLSILRNGDAGTIGPSTTVPGAFQLSGRSLRKQHDVLNDVDYEAEPVWRFQTGKIRHTLLTGFEGQHQGIYVKRFTSTSLPNIGDIYHPVLTETLATTSFTENFYDDLTANYFGLYATDQMDITDKWKIRIGGREDIWNTGLRPLINGSPTRSLGNGVAIVTPNTYTRDDDPFSWNVGTVYRVLPGISTYFGIAHSNLANFSSESTSNGIQAPETGMQYEGGVKGEVLQNHLTFTAAGFDVIRNNVFTLLNDIPNFSNQKTYGFEANVEALVGAHWRLSSNTTIQHAALTYVPVAVGAPSVNGNTPVGVPAHIFNFWTSYDFKVSRVSGFRIGGGIAARDRMFGNQTNLYSVPSYVTLDTVVSYTGHKFTGSVGVRNLTDQLWFSASNGAGGFVGEPRSAFFELKRIFGSR